MKVWLRQNWFKVGILLAVFVAIFVLQGAKSNALNSKPETTPAAAENLKFDIDLATLDYPVPPFTKICIPTSKQYCQNGASCSSMKPSVFLLVDEIQNKYYRCDNKPCDEYDYSSNISGIYNVIRPLPPKQGEIKLSNDGGYYEVVSLGLDLFISQGTCKNIQL
jgi:hypothetical protein